jgi:hypothetical protein
MPSYMIAPVMRGFPGDPNATKPVTMNMPHYMFYAPSVNIGGKPFSHYPFILNMSPGRDDVIILISRASALAGCPSLLEQSWASERASI